MNEAKNQTTPNGLTQNNLCKSKFKLQLQGQKKKIIDCKRPTEEMFVPNEF
jgi:hypothetical protein